MEQKETTDFKIKVVRLPLKTIFTLNAKLQKCNFLAKLKKIEAISVRNNFWDKFFP